MCRRSSSNSCRCASTFLVLRSFRSGVKSEIMENCAGRQRLHRLEGHEVCLKAIGSVTPAPPFN